MPKTEEHMEAPQTLFEFFKKHKVVLCYAACMTVLGGLLANGFNHEAYSSLPAPETIPAVSVSPSSVSTPYELMTAPTEAEASAEAAQAKKGPQEYEVDVIVRRGDTFGELLLKAGVQQEEVHAVSGAINDVYNLRQLKIGQKVMLTLREQENGGELALQALRMDWPDRYIEATRKDQGGFSASESTKELAGEFLRASGTIQSSLLGLASSLDIPAGVMMDVIAAYSFDVDFQRDIQPGNAFEVIYKMHYNKEGAEVGSGELHYASLTVNNENIRIYRFETKDGEVDFYREDGRSIHKTLMKTPINGAVVSSRYGPRKHPVLGYTRMHKGIDFAAPTGTPIYAAGDGRIDFVGKHGGHGKYIRIQHNSQYATAYGHMSRFAKGMVRNKRVKQGQVIGYVGSTGISTGPHLHYEVVMYGKQVNPMTVKIPPGRKLAGADLAAFQETQNAVNQLLATLPVKARVAQR